MTCDVLEPLAVIPQAKNAEYGSAFNLAPGHFGIPAQVRIMVRKTDAGPADGPRG
jgi:hypothetical protein